MSIAWCALSLTEIDGLLFFPGVLSLSAEVILLTQFLELEMLFDAAKTRF